MITTLTTIARTGRRTKRSVNDFMSGSGSGGVDGRRCQLFLGFGVKANFGASVLSMTTGIPGLSLNTPVETTLSPALTPSVDGDKVALSRAETHEPLLGHERFRPVRAGLAFFDHEDGVAEGRVKHRGGRDEQHLFRSARESIRPKQTSRAATGPSALASVAWTRTFRVARINVRIDRCDRALELLVPDRRRTRRRLSVLRSDHPAVVAATRTRHKRDRATEAKPPGCPFRETVRR